ncbi:MAG: aminotransferase class I/II-fold pyridoxal phosphate-dependent enzyme [Jiangellales bacterium]
MSPSSSSDGSTAHRRIYLSPPDTGELERDYVLRALESGWVAPVGPDLDDFERDLAAFTGWSGVAAVSSGTAALHLALLVSGVQPGDDVLVSTFTFAASANAVVHAGGTPVFVDSDRVTWNMDPNLLADVLDQRRRANRLPRALVVTNLYGQCADYDAIGGLCRELGVAVVEDAAEAVGSTSHGRSAGTLADIGVFSFNGNKVMTTSSGGAVLSPDPTVADRVRYLATQARQPVAHYEHTDVGFNYRMSNLLAALGRAQLERLPDMVRARRRSNDQYRAALGTTVDFMPLAPGQEWNGWLTCIVTPSADARDRVLSTLVAEDVEARPLWKPMHEQPVFAGRTAHVTGVSDDLFARGVCLPSGSRLTPNEVDRVSALVARALRG